MRVISIIFAVSVLISTAFGSASRIIRGWQPGEIFFVGFTHIIDFEEFNGLYRSADNGETIELINIISDSLYDFGFLLADAQENTIHRLRDSFIVINRGG